MMMNSAGQYWKFKYAHLQSAYTWQLQENTGSSHAHIIAPPCGSYRKIQEAQTRAHQSASTWQLQENTGSSNMRTVERIHVEVTGKYRKFKYAHSRAHTHGNYRKLPEVQILAQLCRISQRGYWKLKNAFTSARDSDRKCKLKEKGQGTNRCSEQCLQDIRSYRQARGH